MISEDGINHYTEIKSLSKLLRSSDTKHKCKQYFCTNCLQGFSLEASRDKHWVYCENIKTVRVEMPRNGSKIEFCDRQNQFKVPFIMYANFELILEPIQGPNLVLMRPYISEVAKHSPSGWCVYSKFAYREVKDPLKLYRGKDCLEKLCHYIRQEAHRLYHMFPEKPKGPLTKKQWKRYKHSTICHICFKPFNSKEPKVRDHCHYTGRYKGPAHSLCNLRYRIPSYIPVVFHNLLGYDAHLFIRELGKNSRDMEVIVKKTKTKRITLSFQLRSLLISKWIRKAMRKRN